ncbi:MAG: translocation/assembly module TamB [Bryobacteraceae bacterium]|nr:translocation/assembly module TamB [Bryobacteraceae bacterium]
MRRRRWGLGLLGFAALLCAGAVALLSSDWLAEKIRLSIIERTAQASGGKAELRSFHFDWKAMRVTVEGFVLRGLEAPGQPPFVAIPKATLDLQVVSFIGRDIILQRLVLSQPRIHIYTAADGRTNIPSPPKPDPKSDFIATLLRTKSRRLEISDGLFEYDHKRLPFHLVADQFAAALNYEPGTPAYAAELSTRHLRMNDYDGIGFDAKLKLTPGSIRIETASVRRLGAEATITGALTDLKHPTLTARVKAAQPLPELRITGLNAGTATWDAEVKWDPSGYSAAGPLSAEGVEWRSAGFHVRGVRARGFASLANGLVTVRQAVVSAFGGEWKGSLDLADWKALRLDGDVSSISLASVLATVPKTSFPWDGFVSGPVSLTARLGPDGLSSTVAAARMAITPAEDRLPAEGAINARYTQADSTVALDDSIIRLPATELRVTGVLGSSLAASLSTTDLAEVEAAAGLFIDNKSLLTPYLKLNGGSARVEAVVDGPLANPVLSGRFEITRFRASDVDFDSGAARFHVSSNHVRLNRFELNLPGARATGDAELAMDNWQPDTSAPIRLTASMRGVNAADLARIARLGSPLAGRINAQASVQGTLDAPAGTLSLDWRDAAIGEERIKLISAKLRTSVGPTLVFDIQAAVDGDQVDVQGAFDHPKSDWRNGRLTLSLAAPSIRLSNIERVRGFSTDFDGEMESKLSAGFAIAGGTPTLTSLSGHAAVKAANGKSPAGAMRIDASTVRDAVQLRIAGDVSGNPFGGEIRMRLAKGYPLDGRVALPRIPFRDLQAAVATGAAEPWPFQGFLGGDVSVKGLLSEPNRMSARVVITRLQIAPREGNILESEVEKNELVLRNASPITIDLDSGAAYIRSARLSAKDTSLTIAGLYSYSSRSPLDLSLNGTVNLEVLSTFEPDLIASGTARLSANMRGTLADPSINGQMKISGGSFFLANLANGIDNASGTVHFDRNRAQIDNLTGQTGGGTFKINGFVGFGSGEWTYRLSADASAVRVRYPEGVSTTADASLTLTGSSVRSLLAGNVTIRRSGFNMKQDLGSIITGSTNPIPVPATQNPFLRNLQFDIRVRTSPNATFQTSYTRDLQSRADLRLRGSPAKPVILGSVEVNQGEVLFFGNQYTISRGELLFFNTAAIQPSINLDLETRIRGVTVYLNVSGPLSRLDVNYRSEPPLQSQEILALLTVGRTPTATSSTLPASISSRSSVLGESNANTLLGGALSASVSSRVQKFFGASRIKIDPNVTGVENLPQARLTIEQSLSRNIVFTYSINLSRSSQQVVRMEWDLSNEWSLIAVRDENGAFGVDFLYRHRFK